MSDDNFRYYRKRRNEIARKHGLTELRQSSPVGAWATATIVLSTSLRDDYGGMHLLDKFDKVAKKLSGGCFQDDGEAIAVWAEPKSQVHNLAQIHAEAERDKIGQRALFHPGFLPLARHDKWQTIRVENPNPSPYHHDVEWFWSILVKPGLDTSKLQPYTFFVGEKRADGSSHGIHACVRHDPNWELPSPCVTTQKRLNRLIADLNAYVAKLKLVRQRYEEAGRADLPYEWSDKTWRKFWQRVNPPLPHATKGSS